MILIMLVATLLFGCSSVSAKADDTTSMMGFIEKINISKDSKNSNSSSNEIAKTLATDLFDGSEMDLWYGVGNTLVAYKNQQLYIYDVKSDKIQKQVSTEKWAEIEAYPFDNGLFVLGKIEDIDTNTTVNNEEVFVVEASADSRKLTGIIYNQKLQETCRIDFSKIFGDIPPCSLAISPDGSKIAYCDIIQNGLMIYDTKMKSISKIVDLSELGEKNKHIMIFDSLFFSEDNKSIIFSAQTDQNQVTYESWGKIGVDGSGLENSIKDTNTIAACGVSNGKLIFGEDSLSYPGSMEYIDLKKGDVHKAGNVLKGSNVRGPEVSNKGEYFGISQTDNLSAKIVIYSLADYHKIYEQEIQESSEEYFYRPPNIFLFDDIKTGIVTYGGHDGIPLRTVQFQY